jgi:hypothetical protein
MNNLEQLSERLEKLQFDLGTLKVDLSDAINSAKEEQSKPVGKYELSDLMKETIVELLDRFIDNNVFDNLDRDYTVYANGSGCNVEVSLDLNDVVCDQLDSSHRMANNFLDALMNELDNLKDEEEDEITEQREEQREDC